MIWPTFESSIVKFPLKYYKYHFIYNSDRNGYKQISLCKIFVLITVMFKTIIHVLIYIKVYSLHKADPRKVSDICTFKNATQSFPTKQAGNSSDKVHDISDISQSTERSIYTLHDVRSDVIKTNDYMKYIYSDSFSFGMLEWN